MRRAMLTLKSEVVRNQVRSYNQQYSYHSTTHVALYTACVCSSIELQLGSYIRTYVRTCTNETPSLAPLQDLIPTLVNNIHSNSYVHHDAKVEIKSWRGARECVSFVHVCM